MTDPDKPHLSADDEALLKAAQTGEGAIEMTPSAFAEIADALKARHADIEARFPKLVEDCPYETRLAVTAWVFKHLVDHAYDPGTFRYLIYDRLGFESDAYSPLVMAGGVTISNEFDLTGAKGK